MNKKYHYYCEKCGNEFSSNKKNIRFCSNSCRAKSINNFISNNKKPYNYIENKIRYCLVCDKKLHSQTKTGLCREHYITEEFKKRRSEIAKTLNVGGYKKGSGIGKHGWYKGYYCDSSWELAWVIYNLEHNISFERNKKGFEYVYENKTYKYYPDFILGENYIEIKGYLDKKNKCKIEQFSGKLIVLYKNDIKYTLDYTINKYGKDFIKLYE